MRKEGKGVNKTCGGFGEDLPSSRGKVRTKETERGRQRKRKHGMYYIHIKGIPSILR